jgi:hypothetical protein
MFACDAVHRGICRKKEHEKSAVGLKGKQYLDDVALDIFVGLLQLHQLDIHLLQLGFELCNMGGRPVVSRGFRVRA